MLMHREPEADMPDMRIAKLGPGDLSAFKAIRLESLRLAPTAFANTEADWSGLTDDEWISRMTHPVFAAFRGQDPVGIMGLLPQRGERRSHRATLIMAYLRQDLRGTGAADALLRAVMDFATATGRRQIELAVNHHNTAAIRFYLRHGFVQTGRIPAALIDAGQEVDELLMVKRLS